MSAMPRVKVIGPYPTLYPEPLARISQRLAFEARGRVGLRAAAAAGEIQLPPGLVDRRCGGVGEVQAAATGSHRQVEALLCRKFV
jgi:hypothetical protein